MSKGKNREAASVKQLIAGVNKHYPDASAKLPVGGATFTVSSLTQLLQDFVDAREAVEASRAAMRAKVEAERTQAPSRRAVIRALEKVVRGSFGNAADILADFGFLPAKVRTPQKTEEKAVAVAKRDATRKARKTMGKVQKKSVKGAVKATLVVTPLDGPTPAASPPTPAAAAPSSGSSSTTRAL
jgi:hypothetical protein